MMNTNMKHLTSLQVTAILILAAITSGCATSGLPPKVSKTEKQMLEKAGPYPMVIAVERYKYPAYSDKLERDLRATGLFEKVCKLEEKGVKPDLVAEVTGRIHGSAVIPALTVFTLGIIPTITEESWGNDFSLYAPNAPNTFVWVRYEHKSKTILGWVAAILNIFPGWGQRCDESSRYQDQFTLAILGDPQFSELMKRKPQNSSPDVGAPPP